VPSSLQSFLIRPFLNNRARAYIAKLDPDISGNYQRLKTALLREFKLSANVYLECFNTCSKSSDETYLAFASKLTGLLDYYLESRKVNTFDQLCELLVCDRIKSVLSEPCLRYVLGIESSRESGYLSKRDLTEAVDRFAATHSRADKPKAFAIGQPFQNMFKPSENLTISPKQSQSKDTGNNSVGIGRGNGKVGPVPGSYGSVKRCFKCSSESHLRSACPQLGRQSANVKRIYVANNADE